MNLDIHEMAIRVERQLRDAQCNHLQEAREARHHDRVVRHPIMVHLGISLSRFGARLQGIPSPAMPELRARQAGG